MTPEEIARIEERCILKNEEDFIKKCEESGIDKSRYSLDGKAAHVYLEQNSVYGYGGITNCSVQMCVYDEMYKRLIAYKKYYKEQCEWLESDEICKVKSVKLICKHYIHKKENLEYPYVMASDIIELEQQQSYIDAGWQVYYDQYNDYYVATKIMDIKECCESVRVGFYKKTEQRDKETFGFIEAVTVGGYTYPIPADLLVDIARERWYREERVLEFYLSEELENIVFKRFKSAIIEDEYNGLVEFKMGCERIIENVMKNNCSPKELKDMFKKEELELSRKSPACEYKVGTRFYELKDYYNEMFSKKIGLE